jgi:hypothetical protein
VILYEPVGVEGSHVTQALCYPVIRQGADARFLKTIWALVHLVGWRADRTRGQTAPRAQPPGRPDPRCPLPGKPSRLHHVRPAAANDHKGVAVSGSGQALSILPLLRRGSVQSLIALVGTCIQCGLGASPNCTS